MQSPELQAKIAEWRQKAAAGTLTVEDMKAAILAIRGDRKGAAIASEQSKRKAAKAAVPDAKSLLADLKGLK